MFTRKIPVFNTLLQRLNSENRLHAIVRNRVFGQFWHFRVLIYLTEIRSFNQGQNFERYLKGEKTEVSKKKIFGDFPQF